MAVTATYLLPVSQVPVPTTATTYVDPTADPPVPTTATTITAGTTTGMVNAFNANATRIDALGRDGGGIRALNWGLGLSVSSGLTLAIAAGQCSIDGPVTYAGGTLVLTDNAFNYVYLSQAGTILASVSLNANAPPTLPAASVFLGRVEVRATVIIGIDYSGRLTLYGNHAVRTTAESDTPTDTPPSTVRFWHRNATGLYFWDGALYNLLGSDTADLVTELLALTDRVDETERVARACLYYNVTALDMPLRQDLEAAFALAEQEAA